MPWSGAQHRDKYHIEYYNTYVKLSSRVFFRSNVRTVNQQIVAPIYSHFVSYRVFSSLGFFSQRLQFTVYKFYQPLQKISYVSNEWVNVFCISNAQAKWGYFDYQCNLIEKNGNFHSREWGCPSFKFQTENA